MSQSFNQNYQYKPKKNLSVREVIDGISKADPQILSKAITMLESKKTTDRLLIYDAMAEIPKSKNRSFRIGITGSPGVGKSTFIESFGKYLSQHDISLAVLAVDPSSKLNGGSILGDKTRMEELSSMPNIFIRPSPSKGHLGGAGEQSYDSILLCEKAGFDVILFETVGVGQSETHVKHLVDFFLLLVLAGAGDELQGIKRGIMELADAILVTKADGGNFEKAKVSKNNYENATHLFPNKENSWITKVATCSSIENKGIESIWDILKKFQKHNTINGWIEKNRVNQDVFWFHEKLNQVIQNDFYSRIGILEELQELEEKVKNKQIDPFKAAKQLFNNESKK
jgi:LAO/AO transport system kinase